MKTRLTAAVSVALLLTLFAACSKSPTAPGPQTPGSAANLAGAVWTGHIRITSCSSREGCSTWAGALYRFTLTLASGSRVEATLEGVTPEAYVVVMPGVILPDGTHVFSGRSADGRVEIRELRIAKDRDAVITGSIDYTANANRSDPRTITGVIPSATLQRDLRTPGSAGVASLAGTWFGKGTSDTCTGGFSCGFIGISRDFSLTIVESGGRLTALLDSDMWARVVVEMEGTPQADGSVRFAGGTTDLIGRQGEFRHFTVRTDPTLGLTGSFEWTEVEVTRTIVRTGTILSGSRRVVIRSPGDFQGSWRGDYVPRTCSGDCSVVRIGQPSTLQLTLTQSGPALSGMVNPAAPGSVPVQGTASSTAAALDGEALVATCQWDWEGPVVCTQRIRALAVRVDEFNRMTGTFEMFREGWQGNLHYRYTITADLYNVIRRLQ